MTDLRTYLADKLKADGYDGLCDPDSSCGCGLDDLAEELERAREKDTK